MVTKAELHALVDQLPDGQQEFAFHQIARMCGLCDLDDLIARLPNEQEAEAAELLRQLQDPSFDRLLYVMKHAPRDDEPTTPEEDASAAEAWQDYLDGKAIPAEEAKRLLLG